VPFTYRADRCQCHYIKIVPTLELASEWKEPTRGGQVIWFVCYTLGREIKIKISTFSGEKQKTIAMERECLQQYPNVCFICFSLTRKDCCNLSLSAVEHVEGFHVAWANDAIQKGIAERKRETQHERVCKVELAQRSFRKRTFVSSAIFFTLQNVSA